MKRCWEPLPSHRTDVNIAVQPRGCARPKTLNDNHLVRLILSHEYSKNPNVGGNRLRREAGCEKQATLYPQSG